MITQEQRTNIELWIKNMVTCYSFPYRNNPFFEAKKYQTVINVSDEFYGNVNDKIVEAGVRSFWFPLNEECRKDVGVNSIYGAMIILHHSEKKNERVYVHCNAGVHRSKLIHDCYFFMRLGAHFIREEGNYNRLVEDCKNGNLPELSKMEYFLRELNNWLETYKGEPLGGILDHLKLAHLK